MLRNQLYRTLLKLGKNFDKNPRYKAFIFTSEARFPTSFDPQDDGMKIIMEHKVEEAMKLLVDSVCVTGILYAPQVSLTDAVRAGFRGPSTVELTDVERHQLGFMAIRLLSNCQRLADEVSSSAIGSSNTVPSAEGSNEIVSIEPVLSNTFTPYSPDKPLFKLADTLAPGVLLASHPLCVQVPRSNAVILITHVCEDLCSGIILNKQYEEEFKAVLTRKERIRYGYYLKEFYDCVCYDGGDGELDSPLDYCVLHQQDSLAQYSTKLPLSGEAVRSLDELLLGGSNPDALADTGAVAAAVEGEQQQGPKDYVYISYDLQAISKELANGTVRKQDLKIVRGMEHWTDGELQHDIAVHKMFMLQPTARSSGGTAAATTGLAGEGSSSNGSSGTADVTLSECDVEARAGRVLLADIVMSQPEPADSSTVNLSISGAWADPRFWLSGHYAWCKVLYCMGGEFPDLARLHPLTNSPRLETYATILRNLTEYGRRDYSEGYGEDADGSEEDSDFDEDDFTTALALLDEDGNDTGEVIIAEARSPEEGEWESSEFSEFSDDDDE